MLVDSCWNTFPTHTHTHTGARGCVWVWVGSRAAAGSRDLHGGGWRPATEHCDGENLGIVPKRTELSWLLSAHWWRGTSPNYCFATWRHLHYPPATLWPRSNPAGLTYFYLQLFLNTDFACVVSHIESITSTANVYTQIAFCWSEWTGRVERGERAIDVVAPWTANTTNTDALLSHRGTERCLFIKKELNWTELQRRHYNARNHFFTSTAVGERVLELGYYLYWVSFF